MTKERLGRLAQLLADTAETAATIELRALAGGECDGGIAVMASGLRGELFGVHGFGRCPDVGGGVLWVSSRNRSGLLWNVRGGIASDAA